MTKDELVVLLRSWQDFFPLPPTWTGELQRRAVNRGPAPFRWVECAECEGLGRRGLWTCQRCKGAGGYDADAYTGEPVSTQETSWSELLGSSTVNCDGCGGWGRLGAFAEARPDMRTNRLCPRCEGTGKVPAPVGGKVASVETERPRQGDRALDALADQGRRRDEVAIYRDRLVPALEELRAVHPGRHFLVCWIYVLEVQQPSPSNAAVIDWSLDFLLERLPEKAPQFVKRQLDMRTVVMVRARGKAADSRAQQRRDQEIRRRRAEGAKLAELARDFNLDKSRVSRIVRAGSA